MVNTSLSKYDIKTENFDTTNLNMEYTRVSFYRQFNYVICEFLLVPVSFTNTADHTVIFDGKIPRAFRPKTTFKQSVNSYNGNSVRHGLLTINAEGGMKLAMGTANTSMAIYGSVMYPADVVDPSEEIYFFLLSAPTVVQSGENYTVSVLVKNSENVALSKNVDLTVGGVSIGSFATDSNGIASTTVTATGVGLLDILAECEQSVEQISIIDAIVYDAGTDTLNPSSKWYNYGNRITSTITSEGTYLTSTNNTGYYCVNKDEQTVSTSTVGNLNQFKSFVMEFDLVSTSGLRIYLRGANGTYSKGYTTSVVQNIEHIKVVGSSTDFKFYFDGVLESTTTKTYDELIRVGFQVGAGSNITFKNFVLYPIEEEVLDGQ